MTWASKGRVKTMGRHWFPGILLRVVYKACLFNLGFWCFAVWALLTLEGLPLSIPGDSKWYLQACLSYGSQPLQIPHAPTTSCLRLPHAGSGPRQRPNTQSLIKLFILGNPEPISLAPPVPFLLAETTNNALRTIFVCALCLLTLMLYRLVPRHSPMGWHAPFWGNLWV